MTDNGKEYKSTSNKDSKWARIITFPLGYFTISMTQKTIGRNNGQSGQVNLSRAEPGQFNSEVEDTINVDVADSMGIAKATIENSTEYELVIVSKPDGDSSSMEEVDAE